MAEEKDLLGALANSLERAREQAERERRIRAVTRAFVRNPNLPDWMQRVALGQDMTPLAELAVAALDTPAPPARAGDGVWDIGDPEPEGVVVVTDYTDGDCQGCSPHWGRTADGTWKGYKDGGKAYVDWPELVRRWGPVTEVLP